MAAAPYPLDRPVWRSLTTRQAVLSLGDERALRFDPAYGPFAAAADGSARSQEALGALVGPGERVALVETAPAQAPPGLVAFSHAPLRQMIAERLAPERTPPAYEDLGEADAVEMLALATATRPGPFAARTHQLGAFVGVRRAGRLIAMAGERMRPEGFTEVSGVCVDPACRGQGLAAALSRVVAARILARGEIPFLHVFDTNATAIGVYEALGFALRRTMVLTVVGRG